MKNAMLFLILIPIAVCQVDLEDDWIEEGDSFKLGDFKLTPVWTGHSAYITIDEMSVDVPLSECRKKRPFNICLEETRLTLDGEVVPDTINNEDTVVEMKLVVTGLLSEIDLTRTFEKTELLINEETDVVVMMHNNDQADATEIIYEESYPSAVKITDMEGCDLSDGDITWTGMLRPDNFHECSYTITALTDKTFNSKAELEYFNGMEDEKSTNTARLNILDYVLETELDTRSTKLTAGEIIEMDVLLTNAYSQVLDVRDLEFIIPKAFTVIEEGELDSQNSWKGEIIDDFNFTMILQAVQTGTHVVNISAKYDVAGVIQKVTSYKKFTVKPDVGVKITSDLSGAWAGAVTPLTIEIFNPGPKSIFEIIAIVTTDLPGMENIKLMRDSIGVKNAIKVLDTEYSTDYAGDYGINFSLQYKNEFGEIFKEQQTYGVKISGSGSSSTSTENPPTISHTEPVQENEKRFKLPSAKFDLSGVDTKSSALWLVVFVVIAALVLLILRYKIKND